MPRVGVECDRTVTRTVTLLAGLAALVIAVALPLATTMAARDRLRGALETSARLHAAEVAILARKAPAFWSLNGVIVAAVDASHTVTAAERRRVYDRSGRLVIETPSPTDLVWPVLSERAPIVDGAQVLGEAEASRSFRAALENALWVSAASILGALGIFIVLKILPLRLLKQAIDQARYLAAHDVLTGLPNRALFADRLHQALAQAPRIRHCPALLCVDVDRFKQINDMLGHPAGDSLLCSLSRRMLACLREGDTLARLGGDEFAVILPDALSMNDANAVAQRLVADARAPIELDGARTWITISIGIALNDGACDGEQLLHNADIALYQAKVSGRGRICFFDPEMNARLQERNLLEHDLQQAVSGEQFRLHYQPQVDLESGSIIAAEALLRWDRPGHGNLPPDQFIGVAEESGLIVPIGAWVLREACRTAATWPPNIGVAVNVSPIQFRMPGFEKTVLSALHLSGLAPSRLELEITESLLLHDTTETLRIFDSLRAHQIKLAMDDFGTGYSSLGYLQKFRFDKVKIDRQFIQNLTNNLGALAIVEASLAMCRAMGIRTIAEGVDDQEQVQELARRGCDQAQGYLFGRPVPAAEFERLLQPTALAL